MQFFGADVGTDIGENKHSNIDKSAPQTGSSHICSYHVMVAEIFY